MSNIRISNQRGMVSFMITLVMMLVISLIVIGFTQVVNHNRRETLDRQLSAQAFYAAESGVNATVRAIRGFLPGAVPAQDSCNGGSLTYQSDFLNVEETVGYTCVLVNPTAPRLIVSATRDSSMVVPINPVDSSNLDQNISELTFTWSAPAGVSPSTLGCSNTGSFNTSALYTCDFAMLRVDLMQNDFSAANADTLANKTITLFLQPDSSAVATNVPNFSTPKAHIGASVCTAGANGTCTARVQISGGSMFARITTLYRDTERLVIDGKIVNSNDSYFRDAQAIVDVTGKAQDVLRRVQVSVPLQDFGGSNIPAGAIHSPADVCKRFSAHPGYFMPDCN